MQRGSLTKSLLSKAGYMSLEKTLQPSNSAKAFGKSSPPKSCASFVSLSKILWNAKPDFTRIWRVPPMSAEAIQTQSSLWQNSPELLLEWIMDKRSKALWYLRKPKPNSVCTFLMPGKIHSGRSAQKLSFNKFLLTATSPMSNQVHSNCISWCLKCAPLLRYTALHTNLTKLVNTTNYWLKFCRLWTM